MAQKYNTKRKDEKNSKYKKTKKQNSRNKNSKNNFSNNKKHSYVMNGGNICKLFGKSSIQPPPLPPKGKKSVSANSATNSKLVYTGIANVGNTCYMNATLQMLWSIPEIREEILSKKQQNILKYKSYKYIILYILNTIFTVFNSKTKEDDNYYGKNEKDKLAQNKKLNKDDIVLESLKQLNLTSIEDKKYIENDTQQDAQEYLNKLLQFLCNSYDFNTTCKFIDLNKYIKYDEESTTTCLYKEKLGEEKSVKIEKVAFILQLSLSKIDPKNNNISYLIKQYQEIENLSNDGYLIRCFETPNKSGDQGPANKQILIKKPSNNLIIQLKRFVKSINGDGNFLDSNKNKTSINPDPTIQIDSIIFKLQGCIIHTGGTKGGHYVYLVFDDHGNPAFIMDDSRKRARDTTYLTNGYIYYYRRQKPI